MSRRRQSRGLDLVDMTAITVGAVALWWWWRDGFAHGAGGPSNVPYSGTGGSGGVPQLTRDDLSRRVNMRYVDPRNPAGTVGTATLRNAAEQVLRGESQPADAEAAVLIQRYIAQKQAGTLPA